MRRNKLRLDPLFKLSTLPKMKTLKVIFWNLVFLGVFGVLCFGGLEFYLRTYQTFSTETVSAVGVPLYETDELNTYRHKPRKMARNGYGVPTPEIFINSLGLRDDNPEAEYNNRHLLMIGDSFTFGTGVDQYETFPELLQQLLNPKLGVLSFNDAPVGSLGLEAEPSTSGAFDLDPSDLTTPGWQVWNAGHIGYSVGNYYLLLKKYYELLQPEVVVINIFVANDITELRRKTWLKNEAKDLTQVVDQKVFANAKGQLESRTSTVPKWYAWWWLKQRLQVLRYQLELDDPSLSEPTLTWPVFLEETHPAWDPNLPDYWARFFQGLQLMADFAAEKNIELHLVLIPMDVQVDSSYEDKYARIYFDDEARAADRPQKEIMNFCRARELSCLDLLPALRSHPDREKIYFSYNADPHFDRFGHEVVAELIDEHLNLR